MLYFYLYILRCRDGSYYVGHTDNIETRLASHNAGTYEGYTSSRLPVELVHLQSFASRIEALEAEQKIKKWSRAKKEALIAGKWDSVSLLAKKNFK